jgi:hypothetical protein
MALTRAAKLLVVFVAAWTWAALSFVKLAVPFTGTCGCWEETCELGLSRSGTHISNQYLLLGIERGYE